MLGVVTTLAAQPAALAPAHQTNDFSLWRNIQREFSEEFLGNAEHDGNSVDPIVQESPEQVVDVLRSVNTGVNRVQTIELKASGSGKLAKAINGSEKIIAITALPFYKRLTFLP